MADSLPPLENVQEKLLPFAQRYVWWKTPEEAVAYPQRVISVVMDKGDWDDVVALEGMIDRPTLQGVLQNSSAGEFRANSWHFWHKRLFGAQANVPQQKNTRF